MEHINIQGNENIIIHELSKYMNQGGAKIFIQFLSSYINVLDNDEIFEIKKEMQQQENNLGFMIPNTNYYINVKKTTIALIGLLLDIQFTKGFTSFILETFGITADTIRKLSEIEKCVLLLIKTESVIIDEGKYALSDTSNCMNFSLKCTYCQYDKCHLTKEALNNTIQNLLDAKVIIRNGNSLVYCF